MNPILRKLLPSPLYVQVFRNKLVIQNPSDGKTVVKEASFSHPRMLVGEFETAESLLKTGLQEIYAGHFLTPRPQVIMHPKEMLDGGFTMIEQRVLQEMALGAGARQAKVWLGADLSKEETENFTF